MVLIGETDVDDDGIGLADVNVNSEFRTSKDHIVVEENENLHCVESSLAEETDRWNATSRHPGVIEGDGAINDTWRQQDATLAIPSFNSNVQTEEEDPKLFMSGTENTERSHYELGLTLHEQ